MIPIKVNHRTRGTGPTEDKVPGTLTPSKTQKHTKLYENSFIHTLSMKFWYSISLIFHSRSKTSCHAYRERSIEEDGKITKIKRDAFKLKLVAEHAPLILPLDIFETEKKCVPRHHFAFISTMVFINMVFLYHLFECQ